MTLLLDLTLPSCAENLALDEALLEDAERQGFAEREGLAQRQELAEQQGDDPTRLRLWESPEPLVVIGRASRVVEEVDVAACREDGVPIFRRCSGGTAVVGGPGCLMYAVIGSYQQLPNLRAIDQTHQWVMSRMQSALSTLDSRVEFRGTCDLTIGADKISGNAVRCRRDHFLYHGTILYDFPLPKISRYLKTPPRQPDYREGRSHQQFVTNFSHSPAEIRTALLHAWQVTGTIGEWPADHVQRLVDERYATDAWNFRL